MQEKSWAICCRKSLDTWQLVGLEGQAWREQHPSKKPIDPQSRSAYSFLYDKDPHRPPASGSS